MKRLATICILVVSVASPALATPGKDPLNSKMGKKCLARGWSDDVCTLIATHQIGIGMTREQVLWAGKIADRVNQETTKNHVREQWIMSNGDHLTFEDGKLVKIQQRRRMLGAGQRQRSRE